jgi:CheY-like chemotaxis protein
MEHELKKILFVDDDEDVHLIIGFSLKQIPGVELRSATSGEEAIKIAMEFNPDLILLDVMMPKMDGIATLQAIKLLPSLAKIPVIFLTARAQHNEVEEYLKYGILDVIVKPFNPMTFGELVQQIWTKLHTEA